MDIRDSQKRHDCDFMMGSVAVSGFDINENDRSKLSVIHSRIGCTREYGRGSLGKRNSHIGRGRGRGRGRGQDGTV
jgi:hypothetical protein